MPHTLLLQLSPGLAQIPQLSLQHTKPGSQLVAPQGTRAVSSGVAAVACSADPVAVVVCSVVAALAASPGSLLCAVADAACEALATVAVAVVATGCDPISPPRVAAGAAFSTGGKLARSTVDETIGAGTIGVSADSSSERSITGAPRSRPSAAIIATNIAATVNNSAIQAVFAISDGATRAAMTIGSSKSRSRHPRPIVSLSPFVTFDRR